jgi:hypothetical protein
VEADPQPVAQGHRADPGRFQPGQQRRGIGNLDGRDVAGPITNRDGASSPGSGAERRGQAQAVPLDLFPGQLRTQATSCAPPSRASQGNRLLRYSPAPTTTRPGGKHAATVAAASANEPIRATQLSGTPR